MKRKLCGILLVALITVSIFALTSCDFFHRHNWSEWEIVKSPDCQNPGIKERFCDCGETQQKSIPPSHIEGEWITQKESSCTKEGTKYKKCIECQKIVAVENIPIAHKYQNDLCVFCGCSNEKYFTFEQNPSGGYTIYMNKEATLPEAIIIPSTYNGKAVTSIGDSAFRGCSSLESVRIPDSVTSIGDHAFYYCSNLESVTIPDSVEFIGNVAFAGDRLTSIIVDENNNYYKSIDGNLYSKDGKTLIQYAKGKEDTSFEIPYGVTSIGDHAFFSCSNLKSVTIPDSVEFIGDEAFGNCTSLESVTIPDSVESIGSRAFYLCYSLTSVVIGEAVTSIGEYAFTLCSSLESVVIGDGITSIGEYAFSNCDSLTDVYYTGTKEEWAKISIGSVNTYLIRATIHYNYVPEK